MRRALVLAFGIACYAAFTAVFALLIDFVDLGYLRGIDGGPTAPRGEAIAIDLALVAAFGISHSVLARPALKRLWPAELERSIYVLVASLTLALLVSQWRALPDVAWTLPAAVAWPFQAAGIAIVFLSTLLTDHFDLFGLRQTWLYARGRPYAPVPFVERSLYRYLRHPMMVGFALWLWTMPTMTLGRLVFAASLTAYIAIGVAYEERGLARSLGPVYEDYRRRVPAFLPFTKRADCLLRRAP
jgi:protein-S-isoprenylcysteine O-methyltransferase Ste14